ncbi:MAG: CPBP family intramembrane glutamic endopeptidase [Methanoregula sp.]|uniref:CPBP family intramembrane glutamic endopeptidase n=2 Tax=Methanoregula sp. TaxID=2052170 RepID=UPI003BAEA8C8
MTLTRFTEEHPYLSSAVFLLVFLFVLIVCAFLNLVFMAGLIQQVAIADLLLASIGIFLVIRLDWLGKAGYSTGIRLAQVPLFLLPCAFALLSLGDGIQVTAPLAILYFAILTLVVGFAEETYFRGLILTALLSTGTLRAVFISALLFAALHLLNIFGGTWDPTYTVVDIVAAFGLGITYAAIRLRTESIWPVVGIHALFDFTAIISQGGIQVSEQSLHVLLMLVFTGVVCAVYGLFLLRDRKEDHITIGDTAPLSK